MAANVTGAPAPKTQTFALTVTAPPPDFSLAVSATAERHRRRPTLTWNGTLTALAGYSGTVKLELCGRGAGNLFVQSFIIVTFGSGAPFTVTVGNASAAPFNFNIQATDGTLTHQQAVSLNVGTDVTWTDTGNSSVTVLAGQSAIYDVFGDTGGQRHIYRRSQFRLH